MHYIARSLEDWDMCHFRGGTETLRNEHIHHKRTPFNVRNEMT